jgi:TonB family protein
MINKISVPEPCGESWNGMPQQGNGRYCGSCQKVVVDFTNKTNEEILEHIRSNAGKKVCGTFRNSQLTPHFPERTVRFMAALLLVFGMSLFSCNTSDPVEKTLPPEQSRTTGEPMNVPPPLVDTVNSTVTTVESVPECTVTGITVPPVIEVPLHEVDGITTTGDVVIPETEVEPVKPEEPVVGMFVEQMPEFPGGLQAMMEFIRSNIKYPKGTADECIGGTVYVNFIVRKDGSIDKIKILKGIGKAYDDEAMRVVSIMPNWIPGKDRGKETDVQFNLPVKFRLK